MTLPMRVPDEPARAWETDVQTMLLLDDEPHVLAALRRTLRLPLGDGVRMEFFTDVHNALARVGEQPFDLVMADYRMPGLDGVQFLRFVRTMQPDALRMIVSASTEISGVMSAINDVGVFRYVVKPWTNDLLVADVADALRESAAAAEQRRLAEAMRLSSGEASAEADERSRLEALEPGITHVDWGPNGEVLMPPLWSNAV